MTYAAQLAWVAANNDKVERLAKFKELVMLLIATSKCHGLPTNTLQSVGHFVSHVVRASKQTTLAANFLAKTSSLKRGHGIGTTALLMCVVDQLTAHSSVDHAVHNRDGIIALVAMEIAHS